MARKARIKAIVYTFYPDGPDGPALVAPPLSGFTTDAGVLAMYESEVERHTLLYLAEQEGTPVPEHPSAYLVEVEGLSVRPWRKRTNIPVNAVAYRVKAGDTVITYRVHSIRTHRGRVLRETGASRLLNDQQAEAMLTLSDAVTPAA